MKKKRKIDFFILYAAMTYFVDENGKFKADINELMDIYARLLDIENKGMPIAKTTLEFTYGKKMAEEINKVLKRGDR